MTALIFLGIIPLVVGAFVFWLGQLLLDSAVAPKTELQAAIAAISAIGLGTGLFVLGEFYTVTAIVYLVNGWDIP